MYHIDILCHIDLWVLIFYPCFEMGIDQNSMKMRLRLIIVMVMMMTTRIAANELSINYYMFSCPLLEIVVKNHVSRALNSDPTLAAGLLRMHFHDCWIEGCDGSVLIDSTKDNTAEKDSPANLSLRGYEVIDEIKEFLEGEHCPGVVSCADIVAMAARDAVFFAGGPYYEISKGRKDGRRSKIQDTINLPFPTFNTSQLINHFSQRGFSVQDMVALSGAHTLGVARCATFKDRLNNADTSNIDSDFSNALINTCRGGDNSRQTFDTTSNEFDNDYFVALQRKTGVLTSDQTLYTSPRTRPIVHDYAMNTAMFFLDFQRAMIKMSLMESSDPNALGEIRRDCRKVN